MKIQLAKNSFVRCFGDYGYITNQLIRHDRTYNATGASFLKEIKRFPRDRDEIVDSLMDKYGDSVTKEELASDFDTFIKDLESHLFVITGDTNSEINRKDVDFSYSMENPKTLLRNFAQSTPECIEFSTSEIMQDIMRRDPRLMSIEIELTGRCNERCIHCYIPNSKKDCGIDMDFYTFQSLIDQYSELGGLHVMLSGGEVFLHKDILRMIKYCRDKDLQVSVLSNLIALKDEFIPELKDANLSIIQTSLYSLNPAIHDKITKVKGSCEKTKMAIEKLVKADVPVQISCPTMKANFKDYADVIKYARNLRCKAQTDFIMMAQADLNTENLVNRLSIDETEKVIRDIMANDIDYKEYLSTDVDKEFGMIDIKSKKFLDQPLCGAGVDDCCVTANGDVYPCAGWQDMVVGNIHNQTLKEIWKNSPKLKKIRAVTQKDFPECIDCEAIQYCSRCLVRNYNESGGDMFKLNQHFCDVAFLNKRIVEETMNGYNGK